MRESSNETDSSKAARRSLTTRWSIIRDAVAGNADRSKAAMESLCRTYWFPVYAFLRRKGVSEHDAQELTQEFFARLLQDEFLAEADPKLGRFRAYLFTAVSRFLGHHWERLRTIKRGGGVKMLSLEVEDGERRYRPDAWQMQTAEELFDRQWAIALLTEVWGRVRAYYAYSGKSAIFDQLKPYIIGSEAPTSFHELATELKMSEAATKMAVVRLRRRFRDELIESIRRTTGDDADIDVELKELLTAVRR